jgi:hypothetical protein
MDEPVPARVREYAEQAVAYVKRALGVTLEYDSDTLPVLDHYLRSLPEAGGEPLPKEAGSEPPPIFQLVIATAGAYFGEVVRRRMGGRWEAGENEGTWRVILPTGINFSPVGIVASAIAQADLPDIDSEIDAPPRMRPYLQQALTRMGEVSIEDYYSLCGRLDTLEHLHEVLVAVAAQMMGNTDDEDVPEPVPDEPSGPVN